MSDGASDARHTRTKLLAMILTLSALWGGAAAALDAYGRRPLSSSQTWDAIAVAGCRVRPDGSPSLALQRRTATAVELWREGRAPVLLLTGGVGDFPPSEARAAADYAQKLGVPAEALILESRSTSTEENARFAADAAPQLKRVLVVSDAFHIFRVERVFGRYFEEAVGVGSVGLLGSRIKGALREVAAVTLYGLTGRL